MITAWRVFNLGEGLKKFFFFGDIGWKYSVAKDIVFYQLLLWKTDIKHRKYILHILGRKRQYTLTVYKWNRHGRWKDTDSFRSTVIFVNVLYLAELLWCFGGCKYLGVIWRGVKWLETNSGWAVRAGNVTWKIRHSY